MYRSCTSGCAALATALVLTATPAAAWEKCHKPVAATGKWVKGQHAAFVNSTKAWEAKVARSHGRKNADWWYSGDRIVDCVWKDEGMYRCTADAQPCGRA